MATVILEPKDFLPLLKDHRFLVVGYGIGYLGNTKYVCPKLTDKDIKGFVIQLLAGLERTKIFEKK